jgi:predicted small metal-binding protein
MKEFRCSRINKDCNAVLTATTEERLVERVSLHLREVHGMTTLSQDKVGEIKKLFANRATADAARVVDRIFEKYNCNAEPECSWRYIAEAERLLTGSSTVHTQELKAA